MWNKFKVNNEASDIILGSLWLTLNIIDTFYFFGFLAYLEHVNVGWNTLLL